MRSVPGLRSGVAILLAVLVGASGCATSGQRLAPQPGAPVVDTAIANFVQQLPPGSRVQIDLRSGRTVQATLLKATPEAVTVQRRTRLPEPPFEIPLAELLRVQPQAENGRSLGKAIGVGAAAGAAAALGVFLILLAVFSD